MRPTRVLPGTQSPLRNCKEGDLDWVIIRENSEGEYAGQGGRSHRGRAWETATEVSIFTRHGVTRLMRFAFETARSRPRKMLTVVTKSNAQRNGMVLWDEVAAEVAKEFPDVTVDKMLVDAMTTRMVLKPESIDTVVATNLVLPTRHCPSTPSNTTTIRQVFRNANCIAIARRHPLGSCRCPGRLHRHRAHEQPRPQPREPLHVRAHPRLRL